MLSKEVWVTLFKRSKVRTPSRHGNRFAIALLHHILVVIITLIAYIRVGI